MTSWKKVRLLCRRHDGCKWCGMTRPQTLTCRYSTTLEELMFDTPVSRTVETDSTLHTFASQQFCTLQILPISSTVAKRLTHPTSAVYEFALWARSVTLQCIQSTSQSHTATVPERQQVRRFYDNIDELDLFFPHDKPHADAKYDTEILL